MPERLRDEQLVIKRYTNMVYISSLYNDMPAIDVSVASILATPRYHHNRRLAVSRYSFISRTPEVNIASKRPSITACLVSVCAKIQHN